MKKIVIATGIFAPDIGGPATYLSQYIPHLQQEGIEVSVVTFADDASGVEETDFGKVIRIKRTQNIFLKILRYAQGIRREIRDADGLYLHDIGGAGLVTYLVARKRIPYIVRIGGDFIWEQAFQSGKTTLGYEAYQGKERGIYALRRKLANVILRSAKVVIVPSTFLQSIARQWDIGSPEKVQVVSNAVDMRTLETDDTHPLAKEMEGMRRAGKRVVVASGRFVNWKHFEMLIGAAMHTKNIEVYLVGDGPERDAYVRHMQRTEHVHLIRSLPRKELASTLKAADLFVLPSEGDTFSFVALEAFALGTPLLLAKQAALPDIFGAYEGKGANFFVGRRELEEQLKDVQVYKRPGENDIQEVLQQYDIENHYKGVRAIMADIFTETL